MLQDVDERILRLRRILRDPVADALHGVLVEDAACVIAKALLKLWQLAFRRRVRAELEHGRRSLRARDAPRLKHRAEREPRDEHDGHGQRQKSTSLRHLSLLSLRRQYTVAMAIDPPAPREQEHSAGDSDYPTIIMAAPCGCR